MQEDTSVNYNIISGYEGKFIAICAQLKNYDDRFQALEEVLAALANRGKN